MTLSIQDASPPRESPHRHTDSSDADNQAEVQCHLTLERVLGITTRSNSMISVNKRTGEIAYIAGCIVVIYNLRRNRQIRYYRVEQSITSIAFSPDGKYLAIGENGAKSAITVWDFEVGELYAEFRHESYRVVCMAFSQDNSYLFSVGIDKEHLIYVWKLGIESENPIGTAQIPERVFGVDFSARGNYFVTVGEKHIRFWHLEANGFQVTGNTVKTVPELRHLKALMSAKQDSTFISVACGLGENDGKTYALTSDGVLCAFGLGGALERIVSLESSKGFSVFISEAYVIVGGSSAVVRLFDPSTLAYRATLPFPPAFGKANEPCVESKRGLLPEHPDRYAVVTAVVGTGCHAVVLYGDRSLFVYQITDLENIMLYRSFVFHSDRITDLRAHGRAIGVNPRGKIIYEHEETDVSNQTSRNTLPNGTFVSCSDDNTLRFWHLELYKSPKKDTECTTAHWKCPYSQEMLRIVYFHPEAGSNPQHASDGACKVPGFCSLAIRQDGTQVAAGDTQGKIAIFDVGQVHIIKKVAAHSSEVLCLNYSHGKSSNLPCLLASGGRDHRVCIFDAQQAYTAVAFGKPNGSAVEAIEITAEPMRLITSGSDGKVVLSSLKRGDHSSRMQIQPYNSITMEGGSLHDMHVMNDNVHVVTCCNDKLYFHYLEPSSTIKQTRILTVGEQNRFAICPANYCVALSGSMSHSSIQIVEITSGNILAEVSGHAGEITGIQFLPDGRRLISSSSDGCIFVWRLSQSLQHSIRSRLPRTKANRGKDFGGNTLHRAKAPIPHVINPRQNDAMAPPAPYSTRNDFRELMHGARSGMLGKMREDHLKSLHGTIAAQAAGLSESGINLVADRLPLVRKPEIFSNDYRVDDGDVVMEKISKQAKEPGGESTGLPQKMKSIITTQAQKQIITMIEEVYLPGRIDTDKDGDISAAIPSLPLRPNLIGNEETVKIASVLSTSLALERDQLERRKRQIETANAVAAMNSRLSQLGLLKLKQVAEKVSNQSPPDALTEKSQGKRVEFVNLSIELKPVTSDLSEESSHVIASTCDRPNNEILCEFLEKITIPSEVIQVRNCTNEANTLLHSISGYSTKKYPDAIPNELLTSIEASESTDANEDCSNSDDDSYDDENWDEDDALEVDNQPRDGKKLDTCLAPQSVEDKQRVEENVPADFGINRLTDTSVSLPTDVSLSLYTTGYTRASSPSDICTSMTTRQSHDYLPVDVSISAFTVGYTALNPAVPLASYTNEKSMMESSLSVFTSGYSGYSGVHASLKQTIKCLNEEVDASLPSVVIPPRIHRPLSISPSCATKSGQKGIDEVEGADNTLPEIKLAASYSAAPVDVSLSQFTAGYTEINKRVQCALHPADPAVTEESPKSTRVLESLKQQLEVAIPITRRVLEQSSSMRNSEDTRLREIADLMSNLRDKIAVQIFFTDE
uniref:Uncharacterized protein AlNc14C65G4635 n=1 Tax=Albugo laibachii Nc14 TaxID=890382 RepID=F0WDB5_9STRA|nr:conserved hypothetical protein [Albugo laibachii Nc14]|eukprot:CCA19187.1 conserved hypothetical protein [Albugo laibachii Nc14]